MPTLADLLDRRAAGIRPSPRNLVADLRAGHASRDEAAEEIERLWAEIRLAAEAFDESQTLCGKLIIENLAAEIPA